MYFDTMKKAFAFALVAVLGSNAWTARAEITQLSLGDPVQAEFVPGQTHVYSIELPAGNFLLLVDQGGLDLIIGVTAPISTTVNSPTFRDDRETLLLEPRMQSGYTITIDSDEYTAAAAQYVINVIPLEDNAAARGYRLFNAAAAANHGGGESNWNTSLRAYQDALAHWQRTGNAEEQARALYSIAFLQYWQFWDWNESMRAAEQAAKQYDAIGKAGLAANARSLQAAALIEAASELQASDDATSEASFVRALALFDSAEKAQENLNLDYDKAQTINNIGLTYMYRDDLVNARKYFVQAAQEFRRLNETSAELNPLANLAVIDHRKGRLASAVATYQRLLELIPADREAEWRADTLDNLATAQLLLGKSDSALQNYVAALAIHKQLADIKGQGLSVAGIGSTYLAIGEIEVARDYLQQSLELRRTANDGKGQVTDLRLLANIHRFLGEFDVAHSYHEQALELATSPVTRARVQVQQARDWIDTGELDKASSALDDATEAAQAAGAMRVAADVAYESGRLFRSRGDKQQSEIWLHRAQDLYAGIGVRSGEAQTLRALAELVADNDIEAAIAYGLEALDLIEALRSQVADLELRAVYLGRRADYYTFLINSLVQASKMAPTEKASGDYLRRALQVSERSRARATVDLINEAAIDFTETVATDILERQEELEGLQISLTYQRNKLLEDNANPEKIREMAARLQTIRTELDVLESEARESSDRYAKLNDPVVLDAASMQTMLDVDTVLLQYVLDDEGGYLWVITKDTIRPVAIPDRKSVNQLARAVYEQLATPGTADSDLEALSEMIIRPAANELRTSRRVIVAADGALQYIPFSVLSMNGGARLSETHDIVVVPSLTTIAAQREALVDRAAPEMTLAVVGDPVFNDGDPRLVTQANDTNKSAPEESSLTRLPFSAREVEEISGMVENDDRFVATGFDASKARIAGDQLEAYRYVHFATHGIIDASQPALSRLAFSMRDSSGAAIDGYLHLRDIYDLRLNADLVVLSACDTALGREIRGEGLMGLTQGFLYAGANKVVASLWQVPDRATAELMSLYYENMFKAGQDPVSALRSAQLELAADRRWRDPYFWSGFVVQGDWL